MILTNLLNLPLYSRDIRFYEFDSNYLLKPNPIELKPLDNLIGKSTLMSLPLNEYEKFTNNKNIKNFIAPFQFTGLTSNLLKFNLMNGPNLNDLKELEIDDDIDGLDILPKPKPITDFIQKPISTTNKSHNISESILEGQSQWRDRQRKNVKEFVDKTNIINQLIKDQGILLNVNDLINYLHQ